MVSIEKELAELLPGTTIPGEELADRLHVGPLFDRPAYPRQRAGQVYRLSPAGERAIQHPSDNRVWICWGYHDPQHNPVPDGDAPSGGWG